VRNHRSTLIESIRLSFSGDIGFIGQFARAQIDGVFWLKHELLKSVKISFKDAGFV